jgi:hypothetical protein
VANMQYVDRFFFLKHNKEKTIRSAVTRSEKQFADGLVK